MSRATALRRAIARATCLAAAAVALAPWPVRLAAQSPRAPAARAADVGADSLLDAFDDVAAWSAVPSDGVSLRIARDSGARGGAMRLDVDFRGGGGYAVARRALPLVLPDNYELSFLVRGTLPANNVEVKLIDASGENVWWVNRRDYTFGGQWTRFVVKRRQVSFAWGPLGGGTLGRLATLEIAVTAGSGGRGSVWIDELTLAPRAPVAARPPAPRAIARGGTPDARATTAVDGRPGTVWRSAADTGAMLALDLGVTRELGGLVIDWDARDWARAYDVELSADGARWDLAYVLRDGDGGRDRVPLPESEARWVRITPRATSRGRGVGIREVAVAPLAAGATPNAPYFATARDVPRGTYPRAFTDSVQTYWTVIGAPGAEREALVGEDGAVEVGKGMFSLEPALHVDGRLLTWADVRVTHSLERGDLPMPTVAWRGRGADSTLALETTGWVEGMGDSALLVLRYRVANRGRLPRAATLFVLVRPFQVNAPWQFLNTPGGAAPIRHIALDRRVVRVNAVDAPGASGRASAVDIVPLTPPDSFGAATFDAGDGWAALRAGRVPDMARASDSLGRASGALAWRLALAAGAEQVVVVAVPFRDAARAGMPMPPMAPLPVLSAATATAYADASHAATRAAWAARVDQVGLQLPPSAARIARTLRSTQAYILINQDGPAIQPGSRSYERSWIRDGSLTSEALLRTGHARNVRDFLAWYAPFQYPSGKVPCCVDARGADPVPEHDSHGQLIFLVREHFRYTGDTAFMARHWPHVARAAAHIDSLRRTRRTPEYDAPALRHFRGLLPPSISHEGYSAKAMHSYWDDFFALRGLKDAAMLAATLGKADTARMFTASANEFRADVLASIDAAMRVHRIDYIPGAADLGDFDATSTTTALAPGGELARLPRAALEATFARYWREHLRRTSGRAAWDVFTPYELRTPGAFVRLGQPARAHAMLDFFFDYQRPAAWNQWAEAVGRVARRPMFVGDMPHTWVGSDFIRSVLDFFAWEREADDALVIGAGIPDAWLREDSTGVALRGLRTPGGSLDVAMRGTPGGARVTLGGDARAPAGGYEVRAPFPRRARSATLDGVAVPLTADGAVIVRSLPARIEFRYQQSGTP